MLWLLLHLSILSRSRGISLEGNSPGKWQYSSEIFFFLMQTPPSPTEHYKESPRWGLFSQAWWYQWAFYKYNKTSFPSYLVRFHQIFSYFRLQALHNQWLGFSCLNSFLTNLPKASLFKSITLFRMSPLAYFIKLPPSYGLLFKQHNLPVIINIKKSKCNHQAHFKTL